MATESGGTPAGDPSLTTAAAARPRAGTIARVWAPLLALWAASAVALSVLMTKVVNWYLMTDELFYERLAISVVKHLSLLPRVHGDLVPTLNQLYPVLLAPAFRHDLVIDALFDAHVINTWLMTSACIPAFLLARRATGNLWIAYGVAVLTITVPWIAYSGFLLTEVAGYPAFAWGVYLIHRTTDAPSRGNDWLALTGIALAISARVQFVVLLAVPPLALYAHSLAHASGGRLRARVTAAARDAVRAHRTLAIVYAVLGVAALLALAVGRLATALGTYKSTVTGDVVPDGIVEGLIERVSTLALGLGLLPFMLGVAWLLVTVVRPESRRAHAFACVAAAVLAVLLVEVTLFDLRFGRPPLIADRYLFYIAPVVFAAFGCALVAERWPRWSFLAVAAVVTLGFSLGELPTFYTLSLDAVTSAVNEHVVNLAGSHDSGRWFVILLVVVGSLLYLEASVVLRRSLLAPLLGVVALTTLALETVATFDKMFRVVDTGRRQLTYDQSSVYGWIDPLLLGERDPEVTMIPYPGRPGDYFRSVDDWWTLEFWNKAVVRAGHYQGQYEWTPSTFAKLYLRFDPRTGRANVSPTRFAAQSDKDTRFRISGGVRALPSDVMLVEAEQPWRTDWLSDGLFADGWTIPGREARVRVFPFPGQEQPVTRVLFLSVMAPAEVEARRFEASSTIDTWSGTALGAEKTGRAILVCVPPDGFGEVEISTRESSEIYGEMRDLASFGAPREGGILVTQIALADELAGPCSEDPTGG